MSIGNVTLETDAAVIGLPYNELYIDSVTFIANKATIAYILRYQAYMVLTKPADNQWI